MKREMIYGILIGMVSTLGAYQATKYFSEQEVVRAVRRRYKGKIKKNDIYIIFKIGKPNFAERKFIKLCKKSGEPFPIKKIQLKLVA